MLESLLLTLTLAVPVQDTPRPSHVVFVLIDTCRAGKLGMYRDDRETTPFLSSLAEDGVVFERCRSQAPWTKPSMAAMLTSRYPSELGITDLFQQLPDRWTLFPEVLAAAGSLGGDASVEAALAGATPEQAESQPASQQHTRGEPHTPATPAHHRTMADLALVARGRQATACIPQRLSLQMQSQSQRSLDTPAAREGPSERQETQGAPDNRGPNGASKPDSLTRPFS